jgi:hypothetical protein
VDVQQTNPRVLVRPINPEEGAVAQLTSQKEKVVVQQTNQKVLVDVPSISQPEKAGVQ